MTSSNQSVSSSSSVVRRTLVVGSVVSAVALVLSSSLFPHPSQAQQPAPLAASVQQATQAPVVVKGLPDFTELVERVGPAVVSIRTTQRVVERDDDDEDEAQAQMREFLKRFFGAPMPGPTPGNPAPKKSPQPKGQQQGEERPRGIGSGFILSADGYVLTNAHVVDGADEVYVNLTDKREFKAKVIGADKRTDVAVLKIEASKLPIVAIGDAARLKVGEWVMAIGTPFGLENTVTAGIVSAKARDTGEEIRFLQTDVAVNPGNSGGPLINMRGEVVGINSRILSESGGYMGISLSIPIDDAMKIVEQLKGGGKVVRGLIGVRLGPVTKDIAESISLPKAQGAQVQGVVAGSPAQKAGIKTGDIITKFNGEPVEKPSDLSRMVAATKPGTKSSIEVFRLGSSKQLSVTVGDMETGDKQAAKEPADTSEGKLATSMLGLKVTNLSAEQRSALGEDGGGVLVQAVDGPAARIHMRPGDVLMTVANVRVNSVSELESVLAKAGKTPRLSLLVRRGDWAQFVVIQPNTK